MRISDWSSDVCSSDLIARHELALDLHLLATARLGHGFGRHFDLLDELIEPHAFGLGHDRIADLALEAGISVDDVPARHARVPCPLSFLRSAGEVQQALAERSERARGGKEGGGRGRSWWG